MNDNELQQQYNLAYQEIRNKFETPKQRDFNFNLQQFNKDYDKQAQSQRTQIMKKIELTKSHYKSKGFNVIGKDLYCPGFYSFTIQSKADNNKSFQILIQEKYVYEELNFLININQNLHFALSLLDYQLIEFGNNRFMTTVWEGGNLIHVTQIKNKFNNDQKKLNYIFWAIQALFYFHNQNIILLNINPRYFYDLDGRDVLFPVDFSIQGELSTIQLESKNYFNQNQDYQKSISLWNLGQTLIIILCNQQLFDNHQDMIKQYKKGRQFLYSLIDTKCQNLPQQGTQIIKDMMVLEINCNI